MRMPSPSTKISDDTIKKLREFFEYSKPPSESKAKIQEAIPFSLLSDGSINPTIQDVFRQYYTRLAEKLSVYDGKVYLSSN